MITVMVELEAFKQFSRPKGKKLEPFHIVFMNYLFTIMFFVFFTVC